MAFRSPAPRGPLRNDTLFAMGLVSTRIEVTAHRSDLGRWRAAQRSADPRLRDYVIGYFASRSFLPKPLQERHLPSREVAIVLNFAAPHRTIDPSDPKRTTERRNLPSMADFRGSSRAMRRLHTTGQLGLTSSRTLLLDDWRPRLLLLRVCSIHGGYSRSLPPMSIWRGCRRNSDAAGVI